MKTFDIIIIGAGGAGLMAARELGKLKYKTLLVDRKDDLLDFSFNTLGSFIDLAQFDLSENVVAQPINKVILYSKNFKREVELKAYILDKRKLHEELIASLNTEYVEILTDTTIKKMNVDSDGKINSIVDNKENSYQAKVFIDATGLNGVLSKQVGLQQKKTKLAIGVEYNVKYKGNINEAHLLIGKTYQGGYGWIFPLKNDRAIIGFGTYDDIVVKELKKRLDSIIKLPHISKIVEKDTDKSEGGSLPLTEVLDKFVYHNLVCIGDSVSQVNPIVGEGYKFIFESAVFAVKAIDQAIQHQDLGLLKNYEEDWKKRFYENYLFAKNAQGKIFKFSKSDFLVNLAMLYLKVKPNEKVMKVLAGEYSRKK